MPFFSLTHSSPSIKRAIFALWAGLVILLCIPLTASFFTDEVMWSGFDYLFATIMLGLVGVAGHAAILSPRSLFFKLGVLLMIAAIFLIVWICLAVGFIGDVTDPANLMFTALILLVLTGCVVTKLNPKKMASVMMTTAAFQFASLIAGVAIFDAELVAILAQMILIIVWLMIASLFKTDSIRQ